MFSSLEMLGEQIYYTCIAFMNITEMNIKLHQRYTCSQGLKKENITKQIFKKIVVILYIRTYLVSMVSGCFALV